MAWGLRVLWIIILRQIIVVSPSAALALLFFATSATAEPKDGAATALAQEAMDGDYLATRFKAAEQKLKRAQRDCGRGGCSAQVQARLHRDLAVVYLAGLKKQDKGQKAMEAAVATDPTVQLSPDFATPELKQAFAQAGGIEAEAAEEPVSAQRNPLDGAPVAEAPALAEAAAPAGSSLLNWFSLSFQQDLLMYQETTGVCTGAAQYQCFLSGESFGGPAFEGSGNQLAAGVGFATQRLLLGYERVFIENLTLGARVGFAFGGSPKPTVPGASAFLPLHAELRASYWFGAAPFSGTGLRGFAGAAIGVGEVDGHVAVQYYADEAGYLAPNNSGRGTLDAWRKTGHTIAALHAGLAFSFAEQHAVLLELRLLQMLGETAIGGAVNAGYAFGL